MPSTISLKWRPRWAEIRRSAIKNSQLLLLLIGSSWSDREGRGKLANPGDFVRRELLWAKRCGLDVVPILLAEATMPTAGDLPTDLQWLQHLQAVHFRPDHLREDEATLQETVLHLLGRRSKEAKRHQQSDVSRQVMQRNLADLTIVRADGTRERLFRWDYIAAESIGGLGIPDTTELYGEWECVYAGRVLQTPAKIPKNVIRFALEDKWDNSFTGELRWYYWLGIPMGKFSIAGTWTPLRDINAHRLLGLHLKYLRDQKPEEWTIPFHQQLGDSIVGTDSLGLRYVSRIRVPRSLGF